MRGFLLLSVTVGALFAQPNARDLVRQSIANGEKAWRQSFEYYCTKTDISRQLDATGRVKSIDEDVYKIFPLGYGSSFEMHVSHNNEPVPRDDRQRQEDELARRRAESPAQKRKRFEHEVAQRSYMKEVPDAFDFRITGTENLPTGPAWAIEATPRPGYQPKSRYGRMFPHMRGTLWIDKKDVQWVKADAVAVDNVSFGVVIARLAKGSHIVLQQTRLPDENWVPSRLEAKASARTFVFFHHRFEENIAYGDYRKGDTAAAATRAAH
jgi:hypothetical protein